MIPENVAKTRSSNHVPEIPLRFENVLSDRCQVSRGEQGAMFYSPGVSILDLIASLFVLFLSYPQLW